MRPGTRYIDSDSDGADLLRGGQPNSRQPLSLMNSHPPSHYQNGGAGRNYMVLSTDISSQQQPLRATSSYEIVKQGDGDDAISFSSLLNSITCPETFLKNSSTYLLQILNSSQRVICFLVVLLLSFYFYPLTSAIIVAGLCAALVCGHESEDTKRTSRNAKWTITGFSQQLREGFLVSPSFLDKSGQWR